MSLAVPWQPPDGEDGRVLAETLQSISSGSAVNDLLGYEAEGATPLQRAVAAACLGRMAVEVSGEQVVVTAGAQHAITVVLSALVRPGALLLVEDLTYPALKSVAQMARRNGWVSASVRSCGRDRRWCGRC